MRKKRNIKKIKERKNNSKKTIFEYHNWREILKIRKKQYKETIIKRQKTNSVFLKKQLGKDLTELSKTIESDKIFALLQKAWEKYANYRKKRYAKTINSSINSVLSRIETSNENKKLMKKLVKEEIFIIPTREFNKTFPRNRGIFFVDNLFEHLNLNPKRLNPNRGSIFLKESVLRHEKFQGVLEHELLHYFRNIVNREITLKETVPYAFTSRRQLTRGGMQLPTQKEIIKYRQKERKRLAKVNLFEKDNPAYYKEAMLGHIAGSIGVQIEIKYGKAAAEKFFTLLSNETHPTRKKMDEIAKNAIKK